MSKQSIVFDVDGCLLNEKDKDIKETFYLLITFKELGWDIFVHSSGGIQYAKDKMDIHDKSWELDLNYVEKDGSREYDICVDDCLFGTDNVDNFDWSTVIKAKVYVKV